MGDPLQSADAVMNGFYAGMLNMGTDFYEQHQNRKFISAVNDPLSTKQNVSKEFRKTAGDEFSRHHDAAKNQYNRGTHRVRNWASNLTKNINLPLIGNPISTSEEIIKDKAVRRMSSNKGLMDKMLSVSENVKGDPRMPYAPDSAAQKYTRQLVAGVKQGRMVRNWGTAAIGIMAASTASGLASSAIRNTIEKGHASTKANTSMASGAFLDSQMAYTTRQRALRAVQNSQSGMRRALGNEASFLHSYR